MSNKYYSQCWMKRQSEEPHSKRISTAGEYIQYRTLWGRFFLLQHLFSQIFISNQLKVFTSQSSSLNSLPCDGIVLLQVIFSNYGTSLNLLWFVSLQEYVVLFSIVFPGIIRFTLRQWLVTSQMFFLIPLEHIFC